MAGDPNSKQAEQPFLRRWSERKRATAASQTEETESRDQETLEEAGEAPVEMSEQEIEAKLAEIDQMGEGDDFKPLIKSSMPEVVRRAALRRLWRSNPIFGLRDGLNDYDLDYTNAATVVENLKTAYKVGKGYFTGEKAETTPEEVSAETEDSPAEQTVTENAEAPGQQESKKFDQSPAEEQAPAQEDVAQREPAAEGAPAQAGAASGRQVGSFESEPFERKSVIEQDVKSGSAASRRWEPFKTG